MTTHNHKSCKRYDIDGDAHHLTFSCYRGIPLLSKERSCRWLLQALQLGREKEQFHLWAYVIMPEHVHLLLWPKKDATISEILTTLKQSVSKRAVLWIKQNAPQFLPRLEDTQPNGKRSYRFWQRGGGYDRNLRSVADIHEKIEYIHANPVRRGLVATPDAWQWSSCLAWQTGRDEPITIDRSSLPPLMPGDKRPHST